jgi:hypothetical protein
MYVILVRKHIAMLRKARPGIIIEVRWCPARKGVPGNEKADEWAKLVAEEPNAHSMESLQTGARPMPFPRCLYTSSERSPRRSRTKPQQKILWAEVRKEGGRGKDRFTIRDLLADTRCNQPVLDYASTTDVGKWVPPPAEDDAENEGSESKLRERREREEVVGGRGAGCRG